MSSFVIGRFDLLDSINSPVLLGTGFSRGKPVITVSEIQSTILDGAVVLGRSAANRQITIPIWIHSTARLTQAQLANEILMVVNQPSWTIVFTPTGGMPVIYDCFRADVALTSNMLSDSEGWQSFTITAEALPYGRSPALQTAVIGGGSTLIDTFATLPTVAAGAAPGNYPITASTLVAAPQPVDGTTVLSLQLDSPDYQQVVVSKTGLSIAVPAGGLGEFVLNAQQSFAFHYNPVYASTQWKLEITASGTVYTAYSSDVAQYNSWSAIQFALAVPAGATITAYKITTPIWGKLAFQNVYNGTTYHGFLFLDFLHAYGVTANLVSSTNGVYSTIQNVIGSARAPLALALARANSSAFKTWCVHVPPPDRPTAQPLIPFNGATSGAYTTDPSVKFGGTYSVWLVGAFVAASLSPRTVAFTQSSPSGVGTVTLSTAGTTPAGSFFLYAGEVTLPLVAYPDDANVTTTVTVTGLGGGTPDHIDSVLLLDSRGQTVMVDQNAPAYVGAWIDTPPPGVQFGGAYSGPSRASATSVAPHLVIGATLLFEAGTNKVLVVSPEGPMTCTFTYYPRWLQEATA